MAHIDYFFATLSPFTYLAGNRLEEIAARHGATIAYKPLDILALFARTGGTPPKDRHPNRIAYRAQELQRIAKKTGIPFNLQPAHWPTNMAPSAYAVIAAGNAGGGDMGKLVHAILRSCWADEKDVAEDQVIGDCLEEAGFDRGLSFTGMLEGAEIYPRNLEEAIDKGAFGAPSYIVDDGAIFWGQDRLDDLDAHLAGNG